MQISNDLRCISFDLLLALHKSVRRRKVNAGLSRDLHSARRGSDSVSLCEKVGGNYSCAEEGRMFSRRDEIRRKHTEAHTQCPCFTTDNEHLMRGDVITTNTAACYRFAFPHFFSYLFTSACS